ncbi:MAG: hypothetical protein V1701_06250 [Planctomycetota bacterium]
MKSIILPVIVLAILSGCGKQVPVSSDTVTPRLAAKPFARQTHIEVVTNNASVFNPKGGNQTRIVRTQNGVFTAYIVEANGDFGHQWRLAKRQSDGAWAVIAQGDAGTFPVSLLASPDGTLHVIGWSNGTGMIWSGKPKDGALTMTSAIIPDVAKGDYPYPSAGIDAVGNICVFSSLQDLPDPLIKGKFTKPELKWACYLPSQSRWVTGNYKHDYRYTYSYAFPGPDGQISAVSTRDCPRKFLGIVQPPGSPPWVFNAFMYWRSDDSSPEKIKILSCAEEMPTDRYPDPWLKIHEAYLDTKDRMHIIYSRNGDTTGGKPQTRHRIVPATGPDLFDEELPKQAGQFCRIFQDSKERFYLLGASGLLYPMDPEGRGLGNPMKLDLQGHELLHGEVQGMYALSVPRTGTPLSDIMDVGYPADNCKSWFYFRLDFSGE